VRIYVKVTDSSTTGEKLEKIKAQIQLLQARLLGK
jgi:hypothetical protein